MYLNHGSEKRHDPLFYGIENFVKGPLMVEQTGKYLLKRQQKNEQKLLKLFVRMLKPKRAKISS